MCKAQISSSTERTFLLNRPIEATISLAPTPSANALRVSRRTNLIKLQPLPLSTPRSSITMSSLPPLAGVEVTEITYCWSCKAPMKSNWGRCPGCKAIPIDLPASQINNVSTPLSPLPKLSPAIPGAMDSPRETGGAVPGFEQVTRQRELLGFSATCVL